MGHKGGTCTTRAQSRSEEPAVMRTIRVPALGATHEEFGLHNCTKFLNCDVTVSGPHLVVPCLGFCHCLFHLGWLTPVIR